MIAKADFHNCNHCGTLYHQELMICHPNKDDWFYCIRCYNNKKYLKRKETWKIREHKLYETKGNRKFYIAKKNNEIARIYIDDDGVVWKEQIEYGKVSRYYMETSIQLRERKDSDTKSCSSVSAPEENIRSDTKELDK